MRKMKIAVIAAIAVLGLGALGGVAVRANADTSPAPDPATTLSAPAEAPEDANTPDTDNVQLQEGDQSSPDGAAADEADADGPGGPNDQSGNQVEDGQPDTGPADVECHAASCDTRRESRVTAYHDRGAGGIAARAPVFRRCPSKARLHLAFM